MTWEISENVPQCCLTHASTLLSNRQFQIPYYLNVNANVNWTENIIALPYLDVFTLKMFDKRNFL